ncbi:hypothetical protein [Staphylococcus kloosii]|uniref:Uncharacterized protein n=1 Tax=Staphylococcus kloosii TaxID=29384 RepID=A0ABQ0XS99_9STAP|nr:hypothetical protein [Staphylococcus kloosii]AVQ35781.1 hypothetical protein C7J89_06435 [Staphylococcus kloosii]PNZ05445.1 hypothetical protein CD136_07260 [Staphylococcus kloosii]GEP82540.1 hypothetical protein SKL01_17180 [Staphylococcus kloosii]SUM48843.1 phage protein [Staphylococcus kloosii]
MSEPTRGDLLEFMKKHGPENVDSITDKDSAIKHFRTSSKVYKQQRDQYKNERNTLIDDVAILKANNTKLEQELAAALNGELATYDELQNYVLKLQSELAEYQRRDEEFENIVERAIDVAESYSNDNDRLIRRNQKLESYVRMWDKLTKWKQGKLAERCNNDLLHELSYTMNELERDMYKGRDK